MVKEVGSPKLLFENLDLTPIHSILWTGLHRYGPGRPVVYQPEWNLRAHAPPDRADSIHQGPRAQLKDESTISLAQYAARRNLQLVTAADFNQKLRERGCPRNVTVQKVCRLARNEDEVRDALDRIWKGPEGGGEILAELQSINEDLYKFEEMLEQ